MALLLLTLCAAGLMDYGTGQAWSYKRVLQATKLIYFYSRTDRQTLSLAGVPFTAL